MANLTLRVDEATLAKVRRYALEQNSTVNRLVRDFFADIAARQDRVKRAKARLIELSDRSRARIGGALPQRDELHDR